MCECGCAEGMSPELTFAGPDGFTYALAFYTGCRDCDTPAGIILYKIATAQLEDEDGDWAPAESRRALRWEKGPGEWEEVTIGTAWPQDVKAALRDADVDEWADTDRLLVDVAHAAKKRFWEEQEGRTTPAGRPAPSTEDKSNG